MKGNVPPTVIKIPIGGQSSKGSMIRLRNNIRLDLSPDQASLLQNRSLCLLLLFYLSYSMYLHFILYSHVATQDATNRRVSAELDKLNRRRRDASSVSDLKHIEDFKQSWQAFIKTFKSKSHKEEYSEDKEKEYNSYDKRLSRREGQQRIDPDTRPVDIKSDEIAFHMLEPYVVMIPNNTHQVIPSIINENITKYEASGEKNELFNNDEDRAIKTSQGEVALVLPKSKKAIDGKHRRARDVISSDTEQTSQAKGKKNKKKMKLSKSNVEGITHHAQKNKTRCGCRKCVSILLKGAAPTASIRDGGSVIKPWYLDAQANGNRITDLNGHFVLQELNGKIQIMRSGLYMVYAQIYYTSSHEHVRNISDSINSYSVSVSGSLDKERALAVCSVHASVTLSSEVSCHLSIVYHLSRGDRVYLVQREPNRKILLKEGYSYFGLSTLRLDAT